VPWCEDCARFWNPNTLSAQGECPTCGRRIAEPGSGELDAKAPWHFKVLVASAGIYLLWRFLQLAGVVG
jgi:hypothetical protein